jgi:nucleotide-binding universal stress UspA family protein
MTSTTPKAKIESVICPTDLSEKSQKALGFATRLAETLHARLTACHCAPANWFTAENRLPKEEYAGMKAAIREQISSCQASDSTLTWRSVVIENSFDPTREILNLTREVKADLMVMKARPGVLSAFRFGSMVERIIEGSPCPVLLLPSRYLAERDPQFVSLEFRRVLFDYDFSEATDQLFQVANTLARDYHADLEILSVLEPLQSAATEAAPAAFSRTRIQTIVRRRLNDALHSEGRSTVDVPTAVEWGRHAETVLQYANSHNVDLICTALEPPHFYFETLYSAYLGSLLKSAKCPILVKRSVPPQKKKDVS